MVSEDIGNFDSDANIACYCLNILKYQGVWISRKNAQRALCWAFLRLEQKNAVSSGYTGGWVKEFFCNHQMQRINHKYQLTSLSGMDKAGSLSFKRKIFKCHLDAKKLKFCDVPRNSPVFYEIK